MLDRTQPPKIKDAIDFSFQLPPISKQHLKNGIELHTLNLGEEDVIKIKWVFDGGIWYEQKTSVAQAVGALIKSGTINKTAEEIEETVEFYGANLKANVSNDYFTITLLCLTKHLSAILPVILEILIASQFPDKEISLYKTKSIQALNIKLLQPDFNANRHIDAMIFGKQHPYGRYTEEVDILALNRSDLLSFYNSIFFPQNCKIFMSGKFSDADTQMVADVFGTSQWRDPQNINYVSDPVLNTTANNNLEVNINDNGAQAAIRLGRLCPTKQHPDFLPLQILITIFGGYFGARLMRNIREEKGYTYGIYSYIGVNKHYNTIIVSSEIDRKFTKETFEEIEKEMNMLRQDVIPDAELLLVKNYILGSLLGDLDGPFSVMKFWENIILSDLPNDYFDTSIKRYKQITSEELRELAEKYLNYNDYYKVQVI